MRGIVCSLMSFSGLRGQILLPLFCSVVTKSTQLVEVPLSMSICHCLPLHLTLFKAGQVHRNCGSCTEPLQAQLCSQISLGPGVSSSFKSGEVLACSPRVRGAQAGCSWEHTPGVDVSAGESGPVRCSHVDLHWLILGQAQIAVNMPLMLPKLVIEEILL